jgi:hypothetical protein
MDEKTFKEIICDINMSDDELACLLDVSRPTITRWRAGATCPGKLIRECICEVIKEKGY